MRKLIYGLAVAAMAVGVSAFTSTGTSEMLKQASVFYTLNQAGDEYTKVTGAPPSEEDCIVQQSSSCIIGYESDQGANLDPDNLPSQPDFSSTTKGYIQ